MKERCPNAFKILDKCFHSKNRSGFIGIGIPCRLLFTVDLTSAKVRTPVVGTVQAASDQALPTFPVVQPLYVISTHTRDEVRHITKVCLKAVPTPDGLF